MPCGVVRVAEIDGEGGGLGDRVRRAGVDLDFTHSDDKRWLGSGEGLCGEDAFRCSC